MASFIFSEANVKKNFFRIFVKTATNLTDNPTEPLWANGNAAGVDSKTARAGYAGDAGDIATGLFNSLYVNYYEQIGSCNSEPVVSSSDVDGITNNIGTTLGASKEVTVEFTLHDLDGGYHAGTGSIFEATGDSNYASLVSIDGTTVNFVFFDENSGTTYVIKDVSVSVNLSSTGNSFEEVPVTAKKEATTISQIVNRYKYNPGAAAVVLVGTPTSVSIYDGGLNYSGTELALPQVQIMPISSTAAGVTVDITAVDGNGTATAITPAFGGANAFYAVGDLLVMDIGAAGGTESLILRVDVIA